MRVCVCIIIKYTIKAKKGKYLPSGTDEYQRRHLCALKIESLKRFYNNLIVLAKKHIKLYAL